METKHAKKIATKFFYWWWNNKGNNTEQGFDEWSKTDEGKELLNPTDPNGPLSWEDLREEFDRHRCSIFTTESSAPVMNDFLWFKSKIEAVELMCTSRVQALEEELGLTKIHLEHETSLKSQAELALNKAWEENKRLQERLSAAEPIVEAYGNLIHNVFDLSDKYRLKLNNRDEALSMIEKYNSLKK